jgi:hypothetical protein
MVQIKSLITLKAEMVACWCYDYFTKKHLFLQRGGSTTNKAFEYQGQGFESTLTSYFNVG